MKWSIIIILVSLLAFCSPKGPQTFSHPFVGKTKQDLIISKGNASEIRVYGENEAHIYKKREEYFGKKPAIEDADKAPKRVYSIEDIYYINQEGVIYKYQFWRRRVD
ncbi:MAG: hypothetical protein J5I47_06345 [Vicingus serpentipes]|nr:hypothetical protein [Vicingus serpentipes]